MEISLSPPNEKQKLFLTDHHKHVAFGGARGGGKSYGIRMKAIYLAMKHPGITIITYFVKMYGDYFDEIRNDLDVVCGAAFTIIYEMKEAVRKILEGKEKDDERPD